MDKCCRRGAPTHAMLRGHAAPWRHDSPTRSGQVWATGLSLQTQRQSLTKARACRLSMLATSSPRLWSVPEARQHSEHKRGGGMGGGGAANLAAVLSRREGCSVAAAPLVGGGVSHGERRRSGVGSAANLAAAPLRRRGCSVAAAPHVGGGASRGERGRSEGETPQRGGGAPRRRRRLS